MELVIEIKSRVGDISLACVTLKALCGHFCIPRLMSYQLALCTDEILNNIIEHDLAFDEEHVIRICFRFMESVVAIEVSYNSKLEHLGDWKDRYVAPDARDLPERGFGCFLVQEIMDEVIYDWKEGQGCFTLRKCLKDVNDEADNANAAG